MTSDTLTRTMTTAAVILVAAIAAVVSYLHVESLAISHGQDQLASVLLPLSIDGTVAAMSLVMLRCARFGLPVPWLARFMLALAVLATLAANVASGVPHGAVNAVISAWPAVGFVGCVEVSVLMVRKTRPAAAVVQAETPVRVPVRQRPGAKRDKAERLIAADPAVSSGRLAETLGVPRSTAARWKTAAMANGNGRH